MAFPKQVSYSLTNWIWYSSSFFYPTALLSEIKNSGEGSSKSLGSPTSSPPFSMEKDKSWPSNGCVQADQDEKTREQNNPNQVVQVEGIGFDLRYVLAGRLSLYAFHLFTTYLGKKKGRALLLNTENYCSANFFSCLMSGCSFFLSFS